MRSGFQKLGQILLIICQIPKLRSNLTRSNSLNQTHSLWRTLYEMELISVFISMLVQKIIPILRSFVNDYMRLYYLQIWPHSFCVGYIVHCLLAFLESALDKLISHCSCFFVQDEHFYFFRCHLSSFHYFLDSKDFIEYFLRICSPINLVDQYIV